MNVNTLKVSDGDLIIVYHARFESGSARPIANALATWIAGRGLQDVNIVMHDSGMKDHGVSVTVFTVNNVFENEVLNRG